MPHFTTDGFQPYPAAVGAAFPGVVDFGTVTKHYNRGGVRGPDHRYEPPRDPFITKAKVLGAPTDDLLSTSYVERFNLTARHVVGRTRRLCLAFSKTKRGHEAAMSLGVFAYNFVRLHSALGTTPAVAAGVADHPWTIAELVEAALAERPMEPPVPQPLQLPTERTIGAARELPNGRGFLRAIDGGRGAPAPATPPAAPAQPQPAAVATEPDGQLSLLDWRPSPREPRQLSLFGDEPTT